ncbi:SwmB domain-containing protein, partial [Chromatium okenii]|uniref:beta strand repeat-containing protein n=1 Tax=Chromatium okenii TaxID=61644 RepID=UPI0026EA1BCD
MATNLGTTADNINIDGGVTEYNDFGGADTYTILPSLSADVTITDNQASTINLPEGLTVAAARFLSNGVQFDVNGHTVTFIGDPANFTYTFGGTPLDLAAGTDLTFAATAAAFGTTVPAADATTPNAAIKTGVITDTGNVGEAPLTFKVTAAATELTEGKTLAYTVATQDGRLVTADTVFSYVLAGTGDNAAGAGDFSTPTFGSVTILANQNNATFSVGATAADGAEFPETFKVTVKDSAGADVGTVTSTINDTSATDTIAPVVTAAQTFTYAENQVADTVLGTVLATDAVGVTGFEIATGNADGSFAIAADGKISLTAAGLAKAVNDFETAPNSFTLGVKAFDAVGNKSVAADVVLTVTDVDDIKPVLTTAVISGTTATLNYSEVLKTSAGSPAAADFNVTVKGAAGSIAVSSVNVSGNTVTLSLGRAPVTGEVFQVDYTPNLNPVQDAAGNQAVALLDKDLVADTTAPVIPTGQTFTYKEGTLKAVGDTIGTVTATDAVGAIATFEIVTGNESGFYAIDSAGKITATAAGVAAAAASNDFETTPNSFALGVKATDGAGNATTQNVTITVTNDTTDDAAVPMELTLTATTDALSSKSGDDTFIGDQNSVGAADVVDGNDGKDTARFTFVPQTVGIDGSYILTSREVETLKIQNASATDQVTFNAINTTELEMLVSNNSTQTLTVNNIGVNAVIGIVGGDADVVETDDFKVTYQVGKNTGTAKITLDSARLDVLDLTNGFTAYEIATSGTATSTINDFAVLTDVNNDGDYDDAGETAVALTSLKTITFTGDKGLTINNELENVTTYVATTNSGGIAVVIDDAANVSFTGGSGNDRVDVQAQNLTAADSLDGGTGTDTLRIADGDMMTAINAANVKGFETLEVRATVDSNEIYNVDNIIVNNVLTGVTISGGNAGAVSQTFTVSNINSGATGNIKLELTDDAAAIDNVTLTGKGFLPGGVTDTATIEFHNVDNEDGIDVGILSFVNLDVLNIKSTSDGTPANTEWNAVGNLLASDLENIVITGDQSFSLKTGVGTNGITAVNASGLVGTVAGTYGLTLDVSAATAITSLEVKGTTDVDTINASANGIALTFFGNGGKDVVTLDSGQTSSLQFTTAILGSGDMKAGDMLIVKGAAAGGDLSINLAAGVEAVLKSATTNLGAAASNVALITTIDANSNVGYITDVDLNADGRLDTALRIDLNGNGAFDANNDWQVIIDNATTTGVTYNATTDVFTFNTLTAGA